MSLQDCHLVFLNIKATGHVNPTLSIVAELKSRGCQITYFVDEDLRQYVEAAGANWRGYRAPGSDSTGLANELDEVGIKKYVPAGTPEEQYNTLPHTAARNAELYLPGLLEDLEALRPRPSAIIYDPFVPCARAAAHVLRVPAIATLTMPGPAPMAKPKAYLEALEAAPWVNGPRRAIIDGYGFDIFDQAMPMEFYSPVLNLVTTIDELFMPPAPGVQQERFGCFPFKMVGLLAESSVKRIANANVIDTGSEEAEAAAVLKAVDRAIQDGQQILYISLGTVATSKFYTKPFGILAASNGLEHVTGREFAQHIFRTCFKAFGDKRGLTVVLSLGPKDDLMDGLPPLPGNFIARKSLPQLELLKRCHAFVTHGGANSMHEGLAYAMPMVVIPMFGDQPLNGDTISKCGAGCNFRMPMQTVTCEALEAAVDQMLEPGVGNGQGNTYREAASVMARKLADAGGSAAAATAILKAVTNWKAPVSPPRLLGRHSAVDAEDFVGWKPATERLISDVPVLGSNSSPGSL
jgi:UDP:flavonoid glycosyltransferase YjiC (YdhE family)